MKVEKKGTFALFDEMTWPIPSERLGDVEWSLRYGKPSRADHLLAATVIAAYRQMVNDPAKKRNRVVSAIREAQKKAGG